MKTTRTATRIHPLLEAAVLSVIGIGIAGTVAMASMLPATTAGASPGHGANAYLPSPVTAAAPLPAAVRTALPKRIA